MDLKILNLLLDRFQLLDLRNNLRIVLLDLQVSLLNLLVFELDLQGHRLNLMLHRLDLPLLLLNRGGHRSSSSPASA